MAYIKILNLRSKNAIRNATKYVSDKNKTSESTWRIENGMPSIASETVMMEGVEVGEENADIPDAISNLVNYTENALKTEERRFVSGIHCTANHAADEMKTLVDYWKERRRITGVSRDAFHIIQSFNPQDNEKLSPELAHEVGREFAHELQHMDDKAQVSRRYMMLVCTHVDREHMHNHIVMCSYDIDTGRKFHECREVYRQMKETSNRICREHGLSTIVDPDMERRRARNEWEEAKKGTSWKDELRKNIEAMASVSNSWDEYVRNMEMVGYSLREAKYVTYTDREGHRVRDKSLGREWLKDAVVAAINRRLGILQNASDSKDRIRRFYLEQEELRRREAERFSDTVGLYDEEGRRRSDLERILLTAMQMILEGDAYGIGDGYSISVNTKDKSEAQKQRRYRRIAEVMSLAKAASIGTEEELKERLDKTGSELSHVNLEIRKNKTLLNKMEVIEEAVAEYEKVRETVESIAALPEGDRKDSLRAEKQEDISRYNRAKSVLYRYNCVTGSQIDDFKSRYKGVNGKIAALRSRSSGLRNEYKNLMRIKDGLALARNEDFIQGRLYEDAEKNDNNPLRDC